MINYFKHRPMAYVVFIKRLLLAGLLVLVQGGHAAETTIVKTKTELKQLETKISQMQHVLSSDQDKNGELNQELANTEKKISAGIQQLRNTQQGIQKTQHKIDDLAHQVSVLSERLHTQQNILAKHMRARYVMGEYQPLKWLLNQDDPSRSSRILTFHQYIVNSRIHLIDGVRDTQHTLALSETKLHQEINELQQLQQQLNNHQQALNQEKIHNAIIIQSLNKSIVSKQQVLNDYQRNKKNLSALLNTLMQQSIAKPQYAFITMKKKLSWPVDMQFKNVQTTKQGIIIFANEGARVSAVHAGKVVFSDWLNGYGLLIIIDHGQGFMTLYAHNQSLFKQKGRFVERGEDIATVGHSGGLKQNGLYFEVRQRGKAVSPLGWLSRT